MLKRIIAGASLLSLLGCSSGDFGRAYASEHSFSMDRILTVSAQEYCDNQGKEISDYNLVGVHSTWNRVLYGLVEGAGSKFLDEVVPTNTEVIVGYDFGITSRNNNLYFFESGTALIPKEITEKTSLEEF